MMPLEKMSKNVAQTSFWTHNDHDLHCISTPRENVYETSAVVIEGAFKSYGTCRVLQDFQMTVPKGVIYGLLGASGCGKTTVLECTIGSKGLDSGHVYVLGEKLPKADNRKRIGYMPQSTGLYGAFSMGETLMFFGKVIGMEVEKIRERTKYLSELLMLPHGKEAVNTMSEGQQRRVSLAVALLHEPELLVLDEPTVGVDPVLRHLIWDHFSSLTDDGKVTIIITTHYIEETLHANLVGIMRGGCLMAEGQPTQLLTQYRAESLEELILTLSANQSKRVVESGDITKARFSRTPKMKDGWTLNWNRTRALITKNTLWFRRNKLTLNYVLIQPLIIISAFCLSIEPRDCYNVTLQCDNDRISCTFMRYLEERQMILKFFETEEDAKESVLRGDAHFSITIKSNYTSELRARIYNWRHANLTALELSTIEVFRDQSNKFYQLYPQQIIIDSFQRFLGDFIESCGIHRNVTKVPMMFELLHEKTGANYTNFVTPGMLLAVVINIAILLSALSMNVERSEADFQRLLVMGVNKFELVAAHIIVDWIVTLPQVIISMILAFVIFQMTVKGSIFLAASLLVLTSFCGVCYGLLISCITRSQIGISLISVGISFFLMLTCGIFWPIEGMHWTLIPISPFLPLTKPLQSLRNILHKGSTFLQDDVYIGFLSITSWILTFLILSIILIKFQRD